MRWPLSHIQQQIWFHQHLGARPAAYNVPVVYRLSQPIDPGRLERALHAVASRHAYLRTRFAVDERGWPYCTLAEQGEPAFSVHELRAGQAGEWIESQFTRPFGLATEPLIRCILTTGSSRPYLLFIAHHLVCDGQSMDLVARDVANCYSNAPLRESWLSAPSAADIELYTAELTQRGEGTASPDVLPHAGESARPLFAGAAAWPTVQAQAAGVILRHHLGQEAAGLIGKRCAQSRATLAHGLLTGFALALGRLTGRSEFTIGLPCSRRVTQSLAAVVAPLIDIATMTVSCDAGMSAGELITMVRNRSLDAMDAVARRVPGQEQSRAGGPSGEPGLDATFQMLPQAAGRLHFGAAQAELVPQRWSPAPFALSLQYTPGSSGLLAELECQPEALLPLEPHVVARAVASAESWLASSPPKAVISGFHPFTGTQQTRQTARPPSAAPGAGQARSLHDCFLATARAHPDLPAVIQGDVRMSYRDLREESDHFARLLVARGIRRGDRVSVHVRRSPGFFVAVLGILQAGGVCVPLSERDPADRIKVIAQSAGLSAMVSGQPGQAAAWQSSGLVITMAGQAAGGVHPAAGTQLPPTGRDIAFILNTSGTSGTPKAVCLSHAAVVDHHVNLGKLLEFGAGDRILAKAPLNFDASLTECFLPMVAHGTCVLTEHGREADAQEIGRLIEQAGLTVAQFSSSSLLAFLNTEYGHLVGRCRAVLLGAEPVRRAMIERHFALSNVPLYNLYGPSETCIDTTAFVVRGSEGGPVLVGRPMGQARVYVLGERLETLPAGVAGEVFIAGPGLAYGYWGQPGLTAERFAPDPFGALGERMYRTGDVGRWWPGEQLELIGRSDRQVKVRGFRVELAAVEEVLAQHPQVAGVVVCFRGDELGGVLDAYVVPAPGGPAPGGGALRSWTRRLLPEYMVPSTFTALAELPRTDRGKLDRAALPPSAGPVDERAAFMPAQTAVQQAVGQIFGDVLGAARVGLHDDFFEMGGHSLKASQVIARIRQALGVELPLRAVFDCPTVLALSEQVTAAAADPGRPAGRAPDPRPAGPVALSVAQQGLYVIQQLVPQSPVYNMSLGWRVSGELDGEVLERAVNAVVARHEVLRTSFVVSDGRPAQAIAGQRAIRLTRTDLSTLPSGRRPDAAAELATGYAAQPFDLERDPLIRCHLLTLGPGEHVLILVLHHIVTDGWSGRILFTELAQAYAALAAGTQPRWAPLPLQYADYARRQRDQLAAPAAAQAASFWRTELAGAPELLPLPASRPRPAHRTFRGATVEFDLPAALTADLERCSRDHGVTLFMTLLTSYAAVLYRHTGQQDMVIGCPVANRTHLDLEPLIGLFTNMIPLRVRPAPTLTFAALLSQVKTTVLRALAHQDLPFETIVEQLRPRRSPDRNPLFQMAFQLQHAPSAAASLAGLTTTLYPIPEQHAQFDLSLDLAHHPGATIHGSFRYSTDLYLAADMHTLAGQFAGHTGEWAAAPQQLIGASEPRVQDRRTGGDVMKPDPEPAVTGPPPSGAALAGLVAGILADEWGKVLDSDADYRKDGGDFFEDGGSSLDLVVVRNRVAERLGAQVPLSTLSSPDFRVQAERLASYLSGLLSGQGE